MATKGTATPMSATGGRPGAEMRQQASQKAACDCRSPGSPGSDCPQMTGSVPSGRTKPPALPERHCAEFDEQTAAMRWPARKHQQGMSKDTRSHTAKHGATCLEMLSAASRDRGVTPTHNIVIVVGCGRIRTINCSTAPFKCVATNDWSRTHGRSLKAVDVHSLFCTQMSCEGFRTPAPGVCRALDTGRLPKPFTAAEAYPEQSPRTIAPRGNHLSLPIPSIAAE